MLAESELKAKSRQISEVVALAGRHRSKSVNERLRASEEALRQLNRKLNERVKELNCLFGISSLATRPGVALEDVFRGVIELIPPSWQYPEITSARICIADREFKTQNFKDTVWKQTSDITINDEKQGVLEVCYLQEKPQSNEGPFLAEERKLIDAITEQLGYVVERRQAQEQVRNLAKFPSENPNPVLRISHEGAVFYANKAGKGLVADIKTHTSLKNDLSIPDQWLEIIENVLASGSNEEVEFKCMRRILSLTFAPVVNSGYVNVYGLDITERKQAEEATRVSEQKYHQLVKTMNEGLSVSDANYVFTFVNPRFAEILGYRPEEILGHHITDFFDAENKEIMTMQMAQRRRGEEKSYDITWTGKDGRKINTIVSPRAFFDNKGDYTGSLGIITDITKRKQFERQIVKLNEKLEQTVAQRTAKLRKTHKLLLEDIKKRERLEKEIIEISEREKRRIGQELHDSVGQQFTGVAFMAKVLQQRISDKLPQEAETAAEIVKYVNEAVEQTRDIAKALHPVDLSAGGLVKALHELAATTEKLFSISCIFECDEQIEIGDTEMAAHLYRIAQEAITNAIKHGKAKKIRVKLDYNNDKSVLTVRNDGLDFPKKSELKGTGLGLQIMDHRSDIIGGTLRVCKANGGGTILTCKFPFKKY